MATADPPPPPRSDADEAYNLAARVYDDDAPAAGGADDNDGTAQDYNLAARVYDGGAPRPDGSDGADGAATTGHNLAARVSDGGAPRPDGSEGADGGAPRPDGSEGADGGAPRPDGSDGADGGTRAYNLAARVYDGGLARVDGSDGADGADPRPDSSNGADGADGARAYNLAARVYDGGAPRVDGSDGADGAAAAVVAPSGTDIVAPPARSAAALAPPAAGAPPTAAAEQPPTAAAEQPPTAAAEQPPMRLAFRTFESMQVPAFRWFFLAMLGQFSAMNMQMFIRGYLVFDLTGSFAALGVMSLANAIPMFIFSLPGGVLADRASRKWVLQWGQLGNAAIAATICTLLFLDMLRFEHLLASAFVQGVVWSLMMPARQAMIPEIVGEKRLMNAVALSMAGMNVMRLVAPGVGGLMVAWLGGADWVYVLMTASFLFAIVTLLPVPAKPAAAVDRPLAAAGAPVRGGGLGGGGGFGGGWRLRWRRRLRRRWRRARHARHCRRDPLHR